MNEFLRKAKNDRAIRQEDDFLSIMEQRNALDEQIKRLDAQRDKLEAELKLAIGEDEEAGNE